MSAYEVAVNLSKTQSARDLSEADTRHQVLDPILHDVLGWPRSRVSVEEYIAPGYADYVLRRSNHIQDLPGMASEPTSPIILIEAKKEGSYFTLPRALLGANLSGYVQVKTLLTDADIRKAIAQVRTYCLDIGCDFAAITNGHEWIFFRTFQKGEDWKNLRAFVIGSLNYFSVSFTQAYNYFAYSQIVDQGSLNHLLVGDALTNRELFYPKERITAFNASIDVNGLAPILRPIADRYFGSIDESDRDFMAECYVLERDYDRTFQDAKHRIEDALTPYLEQYGIQDFESKDAGGKFGNRLQKSIRTHARQDVVVLFGGKGVGKSTFLKRLLFAKPPQILRKSAVLCVIDLLTTPEKEEAIDHTIWSSLVQALDRENILQGPRDKLLELFADRYEVAAHQDLFGLKPDSDTYNLKLNELVKTWRDDGKYCAKRLTSYWRARHKGAIVVIDNTDQFIQKQEYCFTLAHEIASELGSLVVISMREERFYESSIKGTLDAFTNSGFHISAPAPKDVFLRRIEYVQKLLGLPADERESISGLRHDEETNEKCQKLFRIFAHEFANSTSHLANFLTACAHGNIRLALELFRGIMLSGYTNVYEMTSRDYWQFQIHQVLKPIMIPYNFFYDETRSSSVPNIFEIRSRNHGSHFTGLRLLQLLAEGHDPLNPPFLPIKQILHEFIENYGMKDDCVLNIDMMLRRRLIEANNRLDAYSESVDSLRATAYGAYVLNDLSQYFTYIELVCTDCAISNQAASNDLAALSNEDYQLYTRGERLLRVKRRIEKAERFISYLEEEETRERTLFGARDESRFMPAIRASFDREKQVVMRSASRIRNR